MNGDQNFLTVTGKIDQLTQVGFGFPQSSNHVTTMVLCQGFVEIVSPSSQTHQSDLPLGRDAAPRVRRKTDHPAVVPRFGHDQRID